MATEILVTGFVRQQLPPSSAISIFIATHFGAPVSTTHVITGAISGVGASKRLSAVRWDVTFKIVWAWLLTIPGAAVFAAITYWIVSKIF